MIRGITRFKERAFSDIINAQIISQSIVIVDRQFSQTVPINGLIYNINQNPFQDLNSTGLLKRVIKDVVGTNLEPQVVENSVMQRKFNFTKKDTVIIDFVYDSFPPKLTITQRNINNTENFINNIFNEIIDSSIKNKIGSIGINYELFLNKQCDVKDFLLKENIAKEFTGINITTINIMKIQLLTLPLLGQKLMENLK